MPLQPQTPLARLAPRVVVGEVNTDAEFCQQRPSRQPRPPLSEQAEQPGLRVAHLLLGDTFLRLAAEPVLMLPHRAALVVRVEPVAQVETMPVRVRMANGAHALEQPFRLAALVATAI